PLTADPSKTARAAHLAGDRAAVRRSASRRSRSHKGATGATRRARHRRVSQSSIAQISWPLPLERAGTSSGGTWRDELEVVLVSRSSKISAQSPVAARALIRLLRT